MLPALHQGVFEEWQEADGLVVLQRSHHAVLLQLERYVSAWGQERHDIRRYEFERMARHETKGNNISRGEKIKIKKAPNLETRPLRFIVRTCPS